MFLPSGRPRLTTRVALATTRADAATTRAAELQRQLDRQLARYKKNETFSKAQLVLLLDAIARGEAGDVPAGDDDPRPGANERLRDTSGLSEDDEPKTKPPRDDRRGGDRHRRTCRACRTHCWSPPLSDRVRDAAQSAPASDTKRPR